MKWLLENTFKTPKWLLNKNVLDLIDDGSSIDKVRSRQVSSLNDLLKVDRLGRLIESESRWSNAYTILEMMTDLRKGIWSELNSGSKIDVNRRNIQRAYIDRLSWLITDAKSTGRTKSSYRKSRPTHISQSDIRAVVNSELEVLLSDLDDASSKDRMTSIHIKDAYKRVKKILSDKE